MTRHWVALPLLLLLGCMASVSQVHERHRRYEESEYAPYTSRGTGDLEGQARAKNRWGDIRYAYEDTVYLFPATPYTDEWWDRTLIGGEYLTDPDPRSLSFMRRRVADREGRFWFENLPAGDYYIVCTIMWDVYGGDRPVQVMNLGKRVHMGPGESLHVTLDPVSAHRALIDPPALGP